MTKPFTRASATIITILILCGCGSGWPPNYEELSDHFTKNENAFEQLVMKLENSEYVYVAGWQGPPPPRRAAASNVSGKKSLGSMNESISNSSEWMELFEKTGVFSIRSESGVYEIDLSSGLYVEGKSCRAVIVKGTSKEKHECEEAYADLLCGKCYATINQSWGIEYYWTDRIYIDDLQDQIQSGLMKQADFDSSSERFVDQCRTSGYREIGYSYDPKN